MHTSTFLQPFFRHIFDVFRLSALVDVAAADCVCVCDACVRFSPCALILLLDVLIIYCHMRYSEYVCTSQSTYPHKSGIASVIGVRQLMRKLHELDANRCKRMVDMLALSSHMFVLD